MSGLLKTSPGTKDDLDKTYLKWAGKQMEQRCHEYSDLQSISIFCGTWNVNARSECADGDLGLWLFPSDLPLADIYAIGLQEVVDLNPMNVVVSNAAGDEASQIWLDRFMYVLNKAAGKSTAEKPYQFELVMKKQLVGLMEFIFVRTTHIPHLKDVRASITQTGGMGMLGNKGGIAVRMSLYDSSLCFVCAHFHAGRENVQERNLDFLAIMECTTMPPTPHNSLDPAFVKASGGSTPIYKPNTAIVSVPAAPGAHSLVPVNILNHEHVFWFGDLNYRIDERLSKAEVFDKLASGEWESLRSNDQLCLERKKGNVFREFQEGSLAFPPTYKFVPGTDSYVDRDAKKPRAPAWCDRVLWRSAPQSKSDVSLTSYRSSTGLTASDHRPVGAYFDCKLRIISLERMRTVHESILFEVDKWVNASSPKLAVEGRVLDFGTIAFDRKFVSVIKLKNTGTVMAEWAFVPKNDELDVCKPWLKLFPDDGILAPGETAEVEVCIDLRREEFAVEVLANNGFVLEDIIVLRVMRGSDYFCMVNASINPSSAEAVRVSYEAKRQQVASNAAADIHILSSSSSARPPRTLSAGPTGSGGISAVASTDSQECGEVRSRTSSGNVKILRAASADVNMDSIYGGCELELDPV